MDCIEFQTGFSWFLTIVSAVATAVSCYFAYKMRNYSAKFKSLVNRDSLRRASQLFWIVEDKCGEVLDSLNPVNTPRGVQQQDLVAGKVKALSKCVSLARRSIPAENKKDVDLEKEANEKLLSELDMMRAGFSAKNKKPASTISQIKSVVTKSIGQIDSMVGDDMDKALES